MQYLYRSLFYQRTQNILEEISDCFVRGQNLASAGFLQPRSKSQRELLLQVQGLEGLARSQPLLTCVIPLTVSRDTAQGGGQDFLFELWCTCKRETVATADIFGLNPTPSIQDEATPRQLLLTIVPCDNKKGNSWYLSVALSSPSSNGRIQKTVKSCTLTYL